MFYFKNLSILFFLTILQNAVVPVFGIKDIVPDIALIYLVFICSFRSRHESVLFGFAGGLLQDLMSGGRLGINALSKSIVCFLAGRFFRIGYDRNLTLYILSLFFASVVDQFVVRMLNFHSYTVRLDILIFRYILPGSVYTALIGILFFILLMRWKQREKS